MTRRPKQIIRTFRSKKPPGTCKEKHSDAMRAIHSLHEIVKGIDKAIIQASMVRSWHNLSPIKTSVVVSTGYPSLRVRAALGI